MATSSAIFPQTTREVGSLRYSSSHMYNPNNSNGCTLTFSSNEHRNKRFPSPLEIIHEISVFYLSDTDAEILSTVGMLDDDHRADLIPMIRQCLDDQERQK